jgi:uncharacterized membrane protein
MSPAMSAFQSVGITHSMLILAVLFAVAAGVIGLFWHFILPGAIIIGVALLFISAPDNKPTEAKVQETVTKEVKVNTEEQQFMEDCLGVAEYPMLKCKQLWAERNVEENKIKTETVKEVSVTEHEFRPVGDVKLLDVDNQEYKAKRASAINKPNAVVLQATYR